MYILKEDLMKKRVLSLFMVLVLCLTLLPTAAFAEGEDVSISGGVIGGGETGGEGGGIYVAPGSPTEGGGGTYIPGEDTRTEIWCVSKPDSIGRGYDGTTDGDTIPIDLTFTDGTNEIKLKEGTGFTAKKTFDSADAGWHTVTVEIELIGDAAAKYRLKAGEETFTIGGNINKAYPDLTVTLSKTACTAGEKLLPLLSVEGAPEDAEVTYYYLASAFKSWAGSSDVEGSEAMPKIDENTAISEPGTYYVYAKTGETKNYEEERSTTAELTVSEKVDPVVSVTTADGTETPYGSFVDAWTAAVASEGSTLKLLADGTLSGDNTDISKSITLDLNGYVLGSNGSLTVKNGAALTVKNAGAEKSEKPVKAGLYLTLLVEKGGSFTCTDGKIQYLGLQAAGTGDYAIRLAEGENHCAFGGFAQGDANATIGDLLKATPGMALYAEDAGSTVQIARSTLISKDFNYFSFYVGACSEHQMDANGTCIYCGASYVASVTTGGVTNNYTSLDDALNAAQDGDTVTLLSDVDLGETYVTISKSITFDLNGKTLSSSKAWLDYGVLVVKDATVTVKNGKVKAAEMGSCAIRAYGSGASMTLEDVTATVTSDESSVMVGDFGSAVIKSGDYQGLYVGAKSQVTLEGGTFRPYMDTITTNENVKSIFWKVNETTDTTSRDCMELLGDGCVYVDETGTQVRTGGGFNTVVTVQQGTAIDAPVAKIGDVEYASLSKAINAVQNGGTITLLNDLDLGNGAVLQVGSPRKNFTIDLASHTLSADGDCLIMLHNGSQLTLKNGTLDGSRCTSYEGVLYISSNSGPKLTLENVTAKNVQRSVPLVYVTNGTVEFDGGTYTGGVLLKTDGNAVLKRGTFQKGTNDYSIKTEDSGKHLSDYLDGESLFWKDNAPLDLSNKTQTADEVTVRPCEHNWENGKCTVCQKVCDHGGAEGFDKDAATCPYCGVAAVAETALNDGEGRFLWRRFADLQTAIDADRDGGATLKLLADVTGDYTIDGTQDTGLNLNGHSIKGTVTVKAAAGSNTTTLSNTKNTTTVSINNVVAYKGAKLAGSGKPAVIGTLTLAAGATWKTILNDTALGYKVLNTDGTYKWYAPNDVKDSQLNNVIINSLPITSKTLNLKVDGKNLTGNSPKVERGTTVQLCASCNKDAEVTFSILKTGETTPITLSGNDVQYTTVGTGTTKFYVAEYAFNDVGSYTISFTATKDGYTVQSAEKKLTVTKPNLSNAEITFRSSNESTYEPYRSTTTAPGFTVTYNGKTLKLGVDYTASGTASSAGVSTQTLTIKAVEGSDYTGSKTAEWRIVPHKAKVKVGDVIKAYDGTTDLPDGKISLVSAAGSAGYQAGLPLPLSEGNGFELTDAKYDSANASETEKNISFTVKLTDTNYTFEDGTTEKAFTLNGADFDDKTFQINKATIASDTQLHQTVFNDLKKTYEIDLNQVLDKILPEGGTYGDIQYGRPGVSMYADYYPAGGANIENGKLRLSINKAASFKQGKEIGTVTVQVETTNYQPFTLTIHVSVQDKLVPVPAEGNSVSATDIIYGQTLADSKLTVNGTMQDSATGAEVKGTFAWTDGTIKPDANDRYEAEWTFTPAAGYEKYATVTGTVTIKVKPAKLIVSVKASSMYYTGEEQIASIIASGQSVDSTPVTFTYSDKVDGNYTSGVPTFTDAGTYTAYYKAEAANHEPATGTFTVTIDPLPVSLLSVSSISKTYDGSADVTLTADKLTFFSKTAKATNIKLPDTAITFTNARFTKKQADGSYLPSPEVGGGKALSFTMMLTSNNYVFEGKSKGTTEVSDVFATDDVNRFTITKAAAPGSGLHPAVTVINDLAKTYEMVLSNDYLPKLSSPCEYGNVSYSLRGTYLTDGYKDTVQAEVVEENSQYKLKLTVPAVDYDKVSSVGTIDVRVTSDNYRDFYLTIGVKAKNKDVPVPDGPISASDITYGQALNDSKIAGKMKAGGKAIDGTFTWTNGTFKPAAGDYPASWTFTPAEGYEEYATATGTVTVKVAPKSIEGATITLKKREFTYNAAEQSPTITGVMLKGWSETITTYDIVSGDKAINANDSITLTIKGTGNYTGTATAEWKIIPAKLTVSVPSEVKKEYDGTTNATVTPTFNGLRGKDNLTAADYSVTAAFDNAKVGYKKTVIGKVTLNQTETAKNYVLTNDGNFSTDDGTITKAVAPTVQPVELTIYNGVQADYYVDLPSLPDMGKGKSYGTVGYRKTHTINLSEGYKAQSDLRADPENLNTLRLLLHMTQTGSLTGEIGTVTIPVTTSNYQDITLTVKISAKNRITPTGTPTLSKNAIIYGDALNTIALSGKLHDNVNNVDVDGTFEWVDGTHIPVVGNGTYAAEWIFEPTDTEKYLTVSGRSNITVEKARQYGKLSMAGYTYGKTPSTPTLTDQTGDLNAQVTYSYAAADSGSVQTWDISNPPALNAGTYRMYASIGDTDNYYGFEAVYCEFVVAKATPTYTVPTGLTAKYSQTLADVTLPDGWSWMDSSESVGGASTAAKTFLAKFTPKDTENYNTVENIELEVTVNKADGGNLKTVELEQKYTDASDHTYTPDWAGLPAGQDWTFSSEASIVLPKQDFAADGNLLTYAISGGKAGDKITLILKASCDNYEDFTITLNVTLTEKDDQKPLTITGAGSVVYGQTLTLTTTGGSGTGTVTYRIDTDASTGEATIDPNTGVLTPVKVGSVSVIATKAGDNNYNDVTSAPFVLMIKPATPTGEPKYTKITTSGKTLKDVTLTIEGSTLNPSDGKLEWVDDKGEPLPDDTTVKANTTYKWRFTPDDDNYTTLIGEVELYHKSSSGGGWYDSYYTIKATAGAGGSISPSGNVSVREGGDQTFTITPDKGYAVANVKIDGKSIGAVKSYTFENVSSPHTIEAIFVKGTASASTGDSSNLPLWSALLLASTLALAGAVHLKRKRAR